jgi:hypothetical protein
MAESKLRAVLQRADGRLLATLFGLVFIGLINLIAAYRRGNMLDGVIAAAIFLVFGPWFAVRYLRRTGTNRSSAPAYRAPTETNLRVHAGGVTALALLLAFLMIIKIVAAVQHSAGLSVILRSVSIFFLTLGLLHYHIQFGKKLIALQLEPVTVETVSLGECTVAVTALLVAILLVEF